MDFEWIFGGFGVDLGWILGGSRVDLPVGADLGWILAQGPMLSTHQIRSMILILNSSELNNNLSVCSTLFLLEL